MTKVFTVNECDPLLSVTQDSVTQESVTQESVTQESVTQRSEIQETMTSVSVKGSMILDTFVGVMTMIIVTTASVTWKCDTGSVTAWRA